MGDYFQHYLNMQKLCKVPAVFHVNWFRKTADGKFMWPGFGENARVLAWMFNRVHGTAAQHDSPLGYVPQYEDFDWTGSTFTKEQFEAVMKIDPAKVKLQAEANTEYLEKTIGHASPDLLAISKEIISKC
jgi:phosphoenolpyruvate carboxykinase (GTP)